MNVTAPIHQNPPSHIDYIDLMDYMDLMDYVDEMDFSLLPLNTFPLFDFPTNLPFSELLKIKWWSPPSFEWILRKLVVLSNGLYIWIVWIVYGLYMDLYLFFSPPTFLSILPHAPKQIK